VLALIEKLSSAVLIGSTLLFFFTIDRWERVRPTSPDPAHHMTVLHKGASRLVYISHDDQLFKNWSILVFLSSFAVTLVTILLRRRAKSS
jgi:hypothetical protein